MSAFKAVNRALAPLGIRLARASPAAASATAAPSLEFPVAFNRERLLKLMLSLEMDRPPPKELRAYGEADCDRFIQTLGMVPQTSGRALEIGSNPYFTTILMKQFRQFEVTMTNFFSGPVALMSQMVSYFDAAAERRVSEKFEYWNVNVETDRLPSEDDAFDLVLFCEILEHMTNDPLAALMEIKRVLKPGGQLIVTTPNVARIENVARLIAGENLYDPYSGYGPYGRHNREYTVAELERLMNHCGFEREILFTGNVSPPVHDSLPVAVAGVGDRLSAGDLGQYIFSRWRNVAATSPGRPEWLYRSYSEA
ncbi:methyltransferase domain-containing protein [Glacieibacterium sp.]|uniref:class I SAM-dependent methyltransferase n=1 Tax=Glacieibacterium sp. TaxID=2860237 RepID=UPI003B00DE2A